jgi:hypothetical protein
LRIASFPAMMEHMYWPRFVTSVKLGVEFMDAYWREMIDWSWSKLIVGSLLVRKFFLLRSNFVLSIFNKLSQVSKHGSTDIRKHQTHPKEITVRVSPDTEPPANPTELNILFSQKLKEAVAAEVWFNLQLR